MKLSDIFTEKSHELHWAGASGLWDICRHKIIGVPVLDMFHELAED